jgi:hypothetical protein
MTIHWYCIWSPRYELFYHLLASALTECSGIEFHPQFVPQSVFSKANAIQEKEKHFFAGQAIKMDMMLYALQQHPGEHIVVSDVDILLFDTDFAFYLESYKSFDITCMVDNLETKVDNIGLCFLKSTPEMIAFVEIIIKKIKEENAHDQTEWNALLPTWKGTHAQFSIPDCIQSNMYNHALKDKNRIIQCLAECGRSSDDILCSKLMTVAFFYKDLDDARDFIPEPVQKKLIHNIQQLFPDHPVAQWTFE